MMLRFTVGWNRNPPLNGPSALLNSTRIPRLTCTLPASSSHGTRKMICRSGSHSRSNSPRLRVVRVEFEGRRQRRQRLVDGLQKLRLRRTPVPDSGLNLVKQTRDSL